MFNSQIPTIRKYQDFRQEQWQGHFSQGADHRNKRQKQWKWWIRSNINGQHKVANDHIRYMSVMDFCQGRKNGWHKSWCKGGDVQWMFSADMFPSNVPRFILHWTIHHFTNSMQRSSSMALPFRYREHHLTVRRRVTIGWQDGETKL